MSRAEDVEVTVTKYFCIRLAIALDIVRIDLFWASRVTIMMLVRIKMIGMGVSMWMFLHLRRGLCVPRSGHRC